MNLGSSKSDFEVLVSKVFKIYVAVSCLYHEYKELKKKKKERKKHQYVYQYFLGVLFVWIALIQYYLRGMLYKP